MLWAEQLRAARAVLRWDQSTLAEKAGVPVETVKRLERMDGPLRAAQESTLDALQVALEAAGLEFTNGDAPGVRLRSGTE
jgi:transcriptional regulator with XRE-family HTH domain